MPNWIKKNKQTLLFYFLGTCLFFTLVNPIKVFASCTTDADCSAPKTCQIKTVTQPSSPALAACGGDASCTEKPGGTCENMKIDQATATVMGRCVYNEKDCLNPGAGVASGLGYETTESCTNDGQCTTGNGGRCSGVSTVEGPGSSFKTIPGTCSYTSPKDAVKTEIKWQPVVPVFQIQIPGLQQYSNTDIEQLKKTENVGGVDYVNIPFLANYIAAIYRWALMAAGIILGVFIIIGGFLYMTSGGNAARAKEGKDRITSALLGFILLLVSYSLLYAINPELVGLKSLKIQVIQRLEMPDYPEGGDPTGGKTASEQCLMDTFHLVRGQKPEVTTVNFFNIGSASVNKYSADGWKAASAEILASTDPEVQGILQYMRDYKSGLIPDLLGTKGGAGTVSQDIGKGVGNSRHDGTILEHITYDMHVTGLAVDFLTEDNWDIKTPSSKSTKGKSADAYCKNYQKGLAALKKSKPDDPYHMYARLEKKLASCFNNFNNGTDPWTTFPDAWVKIFEKNHFRWGGWGWSAPPNVFRTDGMHFEYLGDCDGTKGAATGPAAPKGTEKGCCVDRNFENLGNMTQDECETLSPENNWDTNACH